MGVCGVITFYTAPRNFEPPYDVWQDNAIRSWMALKPTPQVVLIGDRETAVQAKRLGVQFSESDGDLPSVRHIIRAGEQRAGYPVLCFLNADNVLLPTFYANIAPVVWQHERFVCIGRRTNLNVEGLIDSTSPEFATQIEQHGTQGGWTGMDYFIYRGISLADGMPDFKIGRDFYDNWLVRRMAWGAVPLIDVSEALTVIHENHPVKPKAFSAHQVRNRALARLDRRYGIKTANRRLDALGKIRGA